MHLWIELRNFLETIFLAVGVKILYLPLKVSL